ncbi:MAG: hypothetical protein WA151_23065, partial [Desulfatirhabdiaceae bacterium]
SEHRGSGTPSIYLYLNMVDGTLMFRMLYCNFSISPGNSFWITRLPEPAEKLHHYLKGIISEAILSEKGEMSGNYWE